MARSIQGPRPDQVREYIPEAFDNRQDPDPYKVWIKDPTEADKRKLVALQTSIEAGAPAAGVDLASMIRWQQEAVKMHVTKVSGYSMRGVEITDGDSLAKHGESEIVAEVALEIFTAASLTEQEKKPSEKPHDSNSAMIHRCDGIAESASATDSQKVETVSEPMAIVSGM